MAQQLPCDGEGVCMLCKATPSEAEKLTCNTCASAWHPACLAAKPPTLAATLDWACPDCTDDGAPVVPAAVNPAGSRKLLAAIREIQSDASLSESEKARRQQELHGGKAAGKTAEEEKKDDFKGICSFCMEVLEKPVTITCGHNFCLKCFKKWVGPERKSTCITCRKTIPKSMIVLPRINLTLVSAIRMAKMSKSNLAGWPTKIDRSLQNQKRPDKAFTTERAKKSGKANASCGKIFVTTPADHFGPITAEYDPERNQGVLVGEFWEGRLECRQWGAHYHHVGGIAGQSGHGAQSVVLSGGYQDDEDHGEWFLYTGSGGRDLKGNKRTNKNQSFDQTFKNYNKALQVSCLKGYPVRVVRSHKEKRSSYAPVKKSVRYDGCYRIEKCWRKVGIQGFKVCRYLFVRCDNEPAPWTSNEHGDRPRPLPAIDELKEATDITEREQSPSWDFDEETGCWTWKKPAPICKLPVPSSLKSKDRKRKSKAQNMTVRQNLLKELSCQICKQVMSSPMTTPCAHNFCKLCLEGCFAGKSFVKERSRGGRSLRSQKNVMKCPSCPTDISDFLQSPQVNRVLMEMIEKLKSKNEEEQNEEAAEESSEGADDDSENDSEETGVNDEDSPTKRSPKRLKFDLGNCSSENGETDVVVNEIPAVKTDDGPKGDSDSGIPKVSNEAKLLAAKHGGKRAAQDGAGAKARGRKKAKQEAFPDNEENGSPSNPLKVQSDKDQKESIEAKAPPAKRARKPAAQGAARAKTRGRKNAEKVEAVVDDAGAWAHIEAVKSSACEM